MKRAFSLLFLLALCSVSLFSQNDTSGTTEKKIRYELDLGFGAYYQFSTFGNTAFNNVRIPEDLPRRSEDPAVRSQWGLSGDQVTDNPYFHGAYFFRLGTRFTFGNSLAVTGAINAEQRGFSDGVFSRNTRNFYPYFNAIYKKELGDFSILLQLGDFWDFKLYEGLTFTNLETQSWIFKLKYKNFYVKHAGVGDLLIGIGLGIDDLYDYSMGLEKLMLSQENQIDLDLRMGYSNNRQSLSRGFWNTSASLTIQDIHQIYSQFSFNASSGGALLIGARTDIKLSDQFRFSFLAEYRRYSSGFNLGYSSTVFYRDPDEDATFVNSTNNVFVPLDYYERNFNQWAIYTEYQDRNISGINWRTDLRYRFAKTLFLETQFDFNWLFYDDTSFLYPFYEVSFGVAPAETVEITLSLNNRVINLDKNFPTFYASQAPYLLLRVFKPLRFLGENDGVSR
jgi:hypothetical protein